jgi:hypothetical protein
MTKDSVLSVIRHLLTFAGGAILPAGAISGDELQAAVGAVISLIGILWGVYDKRGRRMGD